MVGELEELPTFESFPAHPPKHDVAELSICLFFQTTRSLPTIIFGERLRHSSMRLELKAVLLVPSSERTWPPSAGVPRADMYNWLTFLEPCLKKSQILTTLVLQISRKSSVWIPYVSEGLSRVRT